MTSSRFNVQTLKADLFSGWKPFEILWIVIFLSAQIITYVIQPDSLLGMISGITGILCVIYAGKGKLSNYLFGLVFAYSYFYVSLENKFYGEMTTALYVYIPAQFIGYFLWKDNMQAGAKESNLIVAKRMNLKEWFILISILIVASFAFITFLKTTDGRSITLDGVTTVLVVAAQILMLLRYREQWVLWIVINILAMILWAETPAMYIMFGAYLLNSLYSYYNWSKLVRNNR